MDSTTAHIKATTTIAEIKTTTIDYDAYYSNEEPVGPCNVDAENLLGAYMSSLFYFIFFFSVFGNTLVLVIIHR